jgi:hypothetical protein
MSPYDKVMVEASVENAFPKLRPAHKWYWHSEQNMDEPAIFAVWDSADLKNESLYTGE